MRVKKKKFEEICAKTCVCEKFAVILHAFSQKNEIKQAHKPNKITCLREKT